MKKFTLKKTAAVVAATLMGAMAPVVQANAASSGDIVISKVYYAGGKTIADNKSYNYGQYIEIFNNTAKTQDISGMYIALVESEGGTGAYTAGQLPSDIVANGVALKQIFRIPENSDFKLAPHSSAVIARVAIDHSQVEVGGADLSKADFEIGDSKGGDNADVPNLEVIYNYLTTNNDLNLTNGGDASIMLIDSKKGNQIDLTKLVYANGKDKGNQYVAFNTYHSIECVEILKTDSEASRKRFSDTYDKGFTSISVKAGRNGEVVYRKTALNSGNVAYVYDNNNSTEDFAVAANTDIKPGDLAPVVLKEEVKVTIPETGILPFNAQSNFFTSSDMQVVYVSQPGRTSAITDNMNYNTFRGDTIIMTSAPVLLVGKPGEHTVYYSDAQRTIAAAGQNRWAEGSDKYVDGVYTVNQNRLIYKFVNDENPRFVRDENYATQDPDNAKLTPYSRIGIDLSKGENFMIEVTAAVAKTIAAANGAEGQNSPATITYNGPKYDPTGISNVTVSTASTNGVYTIQGMKVSNQNLKPGLYIMGGKKFVVK